MKKNVFVVLLFITVISKAQEIQIGEQVPEFEVQLIGESQDLFKFSSSNDKIILLDFWATWCAPCITGMPNLEKLQKKYKNNLQVITISEEKKDRISRFKNNKSYSFLFAKDDGSLRKLFPYQVIPHSILISSDCKLIAMTSPENITSDVIDKVLGNQQISLPIKKDQFDFDPTYEYFNFNDDVQEIFQLQPYMSGIPAFSRFYNKEPFKDRRLTIFNLNIAGLYRKAYQISTYRLVYEFDESTIAWEDTKNRYCLNVIAKKPEELYPFMRKKLTENSNVIGKQSIQELDVLVIEKKTENINAKKVTKKGETSARGDGFKNEGTTLEEFCNYLEDFGIVGMAVVDETNDSNLYAIDFSFDPENPKSFKEAMSNLGLTYKKAKRKTNVLILSQKKN